MHSRPIVRLMALIFTTVIVPFCAVLPDYQGFGHRCGHGGLRPASVVLERIQTVVAVQCDTPRATRVGPGALRPEDGGTSNDEIGYAGDAINEMTKGLKERDLIKETFGKYVSQQVRDEILQGKIPLDGEHKTSR